MSHYREFGIFTHFNAGLEEEQILNEVMLNFGYYNVGANYVEI